MVSSTADSLRPVYQEYAESINSEDLSPDFFKKDEGGVDAVSAALVSISQYFQGLLEDAHNNLATTESSWKKGFTIAAIELGFMGNTIFAVVETVARVAFALLLGIAALFAAACDGCKEDLLSNLLVQMIILNLGTTPITLLQSAFSTYSNIAYRNEEINYNGQGAFLMGYPAKMTQASI
jgi:hypothetical protein